MRYARTLDGDPSDGMLMSELPAGGAIQTPRHSCQAEANEQLYGDFPAWFRAEKAATALRAPPKQCRSADLIGCSVMGFLVTPQRGR